MCIGKAQFRVAGVRPENYPADTTDHRELNIKVWYPMAAGAGTSRARYLEPAILPFVKQVLQLPEATFDVATHAFENAPVRPGAPYPVAIFSPGYQGFTEAYSAMLEDLASHGVVVVAVDHPYISAATSLASGAVATVRLPANEGELQAVIQQAAETMVEDQREAVDWLSGPDTGLLKGRLDLSRIGAFGHSMGGSSALQSARLDARVKGGMDIDGMVLGDITTPWHKPVAFLLAGNHGADPTVDAVLASATGLKLSVVVPGTGHLDFSDVKPLLQFYAPDRTSPAWQRADLGAIDAGSAIRTTRAQVLQFFQKHVMPVAAP